MKINFATCSSLPLQSNIPRVNPTSRSGRTCAALIRRAPRLRKHDYYFIARHQFEIMNRYRAGIMTGDFGGKLHPRNFCLGIRCIISEHRMAIVYEYLSAMTKP